MCTQSCLFNARSSIVSQKVGHLFLFLNLCIIFYVGSGTGPGMHYGSGSARAKSCGSCGSGLGSGSGSRTLKCRPSIPPTTSFYQLIHKRNKIMKNSVLYCTVLHCTALYCAVLCCAVQSCTVTYCTALHFILLQTYSQLDPDSRDGDPEHDGEPHLPAVEEPAGNLLPVPLR
jgi:hypothetical protein